MDIDQILEEIAMIERQVDALTKDKKDGKTRQRKNQKSDEGVQGKKTPPRQQNR